MLIVQLGIDWVGVVFEWVIGFKFNDYLQLKVLKFFGILEMFMIFSYEMCFKLVYMYYWFLDGVLWLCNYFLRQLFVVDFEDKVEVGRIFNSGGVGMFVNFCDYCSKLIIIVIYF